MKVIENDSLTKCSCGARKELLAATPESFSEEDVDGDGAQSMGSPEMAHSVPPSQPTEESVTIVAKTFINLHT